MLLGFQIRAVEVVLGAPLLEGVEEVHLFVILMESKEPVGRRWMDLCCWPLGLWEHCCALVVWMSVALEEEQVGGRWGAVVLGGEEAVSDPAEVQVDLLSAGWESRLFESTTEPRTRCLDVLLRPNATLILDIHPTVRHRRTYSYYSRGVTRTGAASGAASAAAASAAGAAPGDWRTSCRPKKGLRSRRTPVSGRRRRRRAACGVRLRPPQSFVTAVPRNYPMKDTLLNSEAVSAAFVLTYSRRS
ncbi:hypothetical protein EYF80_007164 [Liparis tanakae]|uniref:Uncharacterized protein n=1 Tax=Liparis tanakae TaxID=230148 RepID=A0A4Z2IXN9_9TELE|nr:hypothetical protein EYF80_007164 [Liparis tanakae]